MNSFCTHLKGVVLRIKMQDSQSLTTNARVCKYVTIQSAAKIFLMGWFLIGHCVRASAFDPTKLNEKTLNYLNSISEEEWKYDLQFGAEFVNKQTRLEESLIKSRITVENGSISHLQLLDALPNVDARKDNDIAKKLLAASLYVYNTKCLPNGISGADCERFLSTKMLPSQTSLLQECLRIIESRRNGHNSFRRLLPRRYKDGIYEMFSDAQLVSPLVISTRMHSLTSNNSNKNLDRDRNLAVAQWAKFIEHDLSKPVVTSMRDGSPIECCNTQSFELVPRYRHPSCAPLKIDVGESVYKKTNCLNYVRSAVAVSKTCTFGAVQQLNQATAVLDLSQLYGFTDEAQARMRIFQMGQIKSSANGTPSTTYTDQLATVTGELQNYCAFKEQTSEAMQCFMAGDSRVNRSPLTISIYTIFMRNHNQIAKKLASKHPNWSDEVLYQTAKDINIQIYRKIVFDEWLNVVLGEDAGVTIKQESYVKDHGEDGERISNEFAVAAIRFYESMMPNTLHNPAAAKRLEYNIVGVSASNRSIVPAETVAALVDQRYKPDVGYTAEKLNIILESILNQPAMKMDTFYEDSFVLGNLTFKRPTHNDLLAYDIQRGRDHGLRSYIDYVALHSDEKIDSWADLEKFIASEDLNKLKAIYNDYKSIDLLTGALAETHSTGAVVGPTFKYILSEQFSQIYHKQQGSMNSTLSDFADFKSVSAVDLLCANSGLQAVPKNIFQLVSAKNPLVPCNDRLQILRL